MSRKGMNPQTDAAVQEGLEHLRQGRLDEAVERFNWALQQDPNHFGAHQFLGIAYSMKGDTDRAAGHLEAALRLNTNVPQTHYNLGVLYERQGRVADAIQQMKAALRLRPDYAEARQALTRLEEQSASTAAPTAPAERRDVVAPQATPAQPRDRAQAVVPCALRGAAAGAVLGGIGGLGYYVVLMLGRELSLRDFIDGEYGPVLTPLIVAIGWIGFGLMYASVGAAIGAVGGTVCAALTHRDLWHLPSLGQVAASFGQVSRAAREVGRDSLGVDTCSVVRSAVAGAGFGAAVGAVGGAMYGWRLGAGADVMGLLLVVFYHAVISALAMGVAGAGIGVLLTTLGVAVGHRVPVSEQLRVGTRTVGTSALKMAGYGALVGSVIGAIVGTFEGERADAAPSALVFTVVSYALGFGCVGAVFVAATRILHAALWRPTLRALSNHPGVDARVREVLLSSAVSGAVSALAGALGGLAFSGAEGARHFGILSGVAGAVAGAVYLTVRGIASQGQEAGMPVATGRRGAPRSMLRQVLLGVACAAAVLLLYALCVGAAIALYAAAQALAYRH